MKTLLTAMAVCSAAIVGHLCTVSRGTTNDDKSPPEITKPARATPPDSHSNSLIVHEWGTFTSFSGSNGVPVGFQPNNSDLPDFVYHHGGDPGSKSSRLLRYGTISMETPVIYFYTEKEMDASIRVDFPRGWITEWYPQASTAPGPTGQPSRPRESREPGETIKWNVKLRHTESTRFPHEKDESPYYHARETDAVPLVTEFEAAQNYRDDFIRGGTITQHEKFLFYRGVGTFPPPVGVQALGAGKVRVKNASGAKTAGLVLVTVRNGQIGFRALDDLEAKAETIATLPEATAGTAELSAAVAKNLIAAGLYEREAQAMVKTWDAAWFHEEGTRLLYLVPRTRTDELLPLTVNPQPGEVVRVLVGRHDFLTPEQESAADRQTERMEAARAELSAAEAELAKLGRFSQPARQMALQRLEARAQK